MNVYGELTRAQLENLGADPSLSSLTTGRVWWRTDISQARVDLGGTADYFLTSLNPTIKQISTPSNPASGYDSLYFKSDNRLYQLTSAGIETRLSPIAPTVEKFTVTGSVSGYLFTVSSANATIGATYTNNGNTYTVLSTISSGTSLYCSQASAPASSGTLTKASGTGDSTITFSSAVALATYTTPANVFYIRVRMVGGGGGGGGSSSASSSAGNGGAGTVSVFGPSLLVANGGSATTDYGNLGGAGGTASLGTGPLGIALQGGHGADGAAMFSSASTASPLLTGQMGASTPFGGAGAGGNDNSGVGIGYAAIANTGSGGGGAGNPATGSAPDPSGAGGAAGGFVDAIITSPAGSYYYCIGSGGAGGAAGTNGFAGGAGGSGLLIVEEFYQ